MDVGIDQDLQMTESAVMAAVMRADETLEAGHARVTAGTAKRMPRDAGHEVQLAFAVTGLRK